MAWHIVGFINNCGRRRKMPLRVSYMPIPVPTATPSWFLLTRRKGIVHHNVRSVGGVFPVLVGVLEELMGRQGNRMLSSGPAA